MHNVLLVKLFDTTNKLFVFDQRKVNYLYFFRVPKNYFDGIYWNYLGNFFNYYFDNQCNVYDYVDINYFLDQNFNANDVDMMVFELCVLSPLRPHDPTNVFHKVNIKSF